MSGNPRASVPLGTSWSSACPYSYSCWIPLWWSLSIWSQCFSIATHLPGWLDMKVLPFISFHFFFLFSFPECSFALGLRDAKYVWGAPHPLPPFKGNVPVPSPLTCQTCKWNTPTLSRLSTETSQLLIIPLLLPEPHTLFWIYHLLFFFKGM